MRQETRPSLVPEMAFSTPSNYLNQCLHPKETNCHEIWRIFFLELSVLTSRQMLARRTTASQRPYVNSDGRHMPFRSNISVAWHAHIISNPQVHVSLTRYAKLRVAHAPGMPGTFSPPPRVDDPDMHHGTCVTHVPCCMPGSLTSGFLWSRWYGKRFQHSQRMCNPQFCVSGKRPIESNNWQPYVHDRKHVSHSSSTVPTDDLTPLDARTSACTVITKVGIHIYIIPGYEIVGFACVWSCVHDHTCWSC